MFNSIRLFTLKLIQLNKYIFLTFLKIIYISNITIDRKI
jgi:hypothetical protein